MVDAQVDSIPSSPVEQKEIDKKDRAKRTSQFDRLAGSRVDIDDPLNRLHEVLGDEWSTYQTIVTDFLTGRSTRLEFETSLQPLIAGYRNFIRLHNDILLCLLSNSFREPPPANVQSLGWSKKRRDLGVQSSHGDPAAKRLKAEVMGLTNRERARIKNIPKPDASHRLRPNSMIETRFAKLPRVPVTPQKINSSQHHIDIVRGFHVPLSTESHYLPDATSLKDRVLATCLENGLLGGLEEQVPDLVINALEIHMRNILTATLSKVRKNRIDCLSLPLPSPSSTTTTTSATTPLTSTRKGGDVLSGATGQGDTLTPAELAFTYSLAPFIFVEPCHPVTRMVAMALDDCTSDDAAWHAQGGTTGITATSSTTALPSTSTLGGGAGTGAGQGPSDKANQRFKVAKMLDDLI